MRNQIHRACLLLAAAGLALSACGPKPNDQASAQVIHVPIAGQTGAAPAAPGNVTLAFFDSDAFDSSLATSLSSGAKDVHVTFAGTTSVNAMPPRINAWLAEVKKTDGMVTAKDPADTSRGLLGLGMIADLIDLVTWYSERKERESQLATVNDYNATVMYDSKTGSLRELVFDRRPAAAAPPP